MKVAAIDLGTNSFLCLIAEVKPDHCGTDRTAGLPELKVLEDVSRVVRLGAKVHQNRFFLPEALRRATVALDEFAGLIKKHQVDQVVATATSAARDVANGAELIKLGRERSIPITIIAGQREAELSFEGAISAISDAHQKNILVIDVGGGSTELIYREAAAQNTSHGGLAAALNSDTSIAQPTNSKVNTARSKINAHSFDVGCVRLTEMFLKKDPVDADELKKLTTYATEVMGSYGPVNPDVVIAVAGTPTTLACVDQEIDFDEQKVEGFILNRKKIIDLRQKLGALPLSERKNLKGLEPLRADVIIAGCVLLEVALKVAKKDELKVSTRGLRYGAALHYAEF